MRSVNFKFFMNFKVEAAEVEFQDKTMLTQRRTRDLGYTLACAGGFVYN